MGVSFFGWLIFSLMRFLQNTLQSNLLFVMVEDFGHLILMITLKLGNVVIVPIPVLWVKVTATVMMIVMGV